MRFDRGSISLIIFLRIVLLVFLIFFHFGCGKDDAQAPEPAPRPPQGGVAPFVPCAGKNCGDECTVCRPADPHCAETMTIELCDNIGQCVTSPVSCNEPLPQNDFNACAGKNCGERCQLCPPNDPQCVETQVLKACDPNGFCRAEGTFSCR